MCHSAARNRNTWPRLWQEAVQSPSSGKQRVGPSGHNTPTKRSGTSPRTHTKDISLPEPYLHWVLLKVAAPDETVIHAAPAWLGD